MSEKSGFISKRMYFLPSRENIRDASTTTLLDIVEGRVQGATDFHVEFAINKLGSELKFRTLDGSKKVLSAQATICRKFIKEGTAEQRDRVNEIFTRQELIVITIFLQGGRDLNEIAHASAQNCTELNPDFAVEYCRETIELFLAYIMRNYADQYYSAETNMVDFPSFRISMESSHRLLVMALEAGADFYSESTYAKRAAEAKPTFNLPPFTDRERWVAGRLRANVLYNTSLRMYYVNPTACYAERIDSLELANVAKKLKLCLINGKFHFPQDVFEDIRIKALADQSFEHKDMTA